MSKRRNNRKYRRRGRFGILYKLMSVIVILGAIVAGSIVFFRVGEVAVAGNVRYTSQEISAAAGVKEGDNLFLLNKFKLARRILTNLPYVDEVNIRRRLPDTLLITVTESDPVASIQNEADWWVIDAKGKILEQGDEALGTQYAVVTGFAAIRPSVGTKLAVGEENSSKFQSLTGLLSALHERGMADKVSAIDMTGAATLTLRYDGRFTVELPMSGDFSRKVWQLDEVMALMESNESGYLDLTGDKGYYRPD